MGAKMRNALKKISAFFRGRYGFDHLSYFLVILSLFFSILSVFFLRYVLNVLNFIIYLIVILRALSNNFVKRSNENRAFISFANDVKSFFSLQKRIFKDRKTHVYRTCPECKVTIRLPKKKGKHTVRCPKCSHRFEVKI